MGVAMNRSTRILFYGMFLLTSGLLLHVVLGDEEYWLLYARLSIVAGVLVGAYGAFNHEEP